MLAVELTKFHCLLLTFYGQLDILAQTRKGLWTGMQIRKLKENGIGKKTETSLILCFCSETHCNAAWFLAAGFYQSLEMFYWFVFWPMSMFAKYYAADSSCGELEMN